MLLWSWVFLGISIFAGLIQTWVDVSYFKKLSDDSSQRGRFFSELLFKDAYKASKLLKFVPDKSIHTPVLLQIIFLGAGLLLIMSVAASLLMRR